jgi:hypothetical protein
VTRELPPRPASANDFVRPFVMTGGRTRATNGALRMETMVQTVNADTSSLTLEHARLAELCWEPCSIAEAASELAIPLGVAIVLVGDMVDQWNLEVTHSDPVEIELSQLTRMIERVRAL